MGDEYLLPSIAIAVIGGALITGCRGTQSQHARRGMTESANVFALAEGLRVLVTAGASGIGRATVDLLIAHGARSTSATYPTHS
jgi:NADPH:quinone reductase-like Zn-dependent oxidoreductase